MDVVFGLSLSQEIHSSLVYKTTGWSLAWHVLGCEKWNNTWKREREREGNRDRERKREGKRERHKGYVLALPSRFSKP